MNGTIPIDEKYTWKFQKKISLASSIKHQASSIKHQASSIKHQASSFYFG